MKLFFILMLTCLLSQSYADSERDDSWSNRWTSGIMAVQNKQYEEAIAEYTKAIEVLEKEGLILDHLYLYNSRGQAYLFFDKFEEALKDFKTVAHNQKASATDKILAQWGMTRSYALLGDVENFQKEFAKVKDLDPEYPKVESNEDYIIFRNFHSDSPCVKDYFAEALVKLEICDYLEDVIFTETGICLIRKKCPCSFSKKQMKIGQNNNEENCQYWCNRVTDGALLMCGNRFKKLRCQWLCVEVVEALRSACYWCCEGEGFYKRCVKPFEDFLQQVPCDPLWD